jgi:hypothetical protein
VQAADGRTVTDRHGRPPGIGVRWSGAGHGGGDQGRRRCRGGRRLQAEGMRWWSLLDMDWTERYPLLIWIHVHRFDKVPETKIKKTHCRWHSGHFWRKERVINYCKAL